MKLSVIIPVYCVEKTLDRCLQSVAAQTVADMEIILVDDGSTDASPALCDQWANKDGRISVIHKTNGGLSDARNAGIEMASGDYITFVDSDDFIEAGTLDAVMQMATSHPDCDIVEYPVNQYEGGGKEQLLTFTDCIYHDVSRYWYDTKAYAHAYACNKIYRRALFREIRYPVGKVFEDIYTLPLLLQSAAAVATCSRGLYHYCDNQHGITAKARGKEWLMLLDAHLKIVDIPTLAPYNDAAYYQHLVNIQLYANELSGVAPVIKDLPYYNFGQPKSVLRHLLGIKTLCQWNRIFRKIVRRCS